MPAIERSSGFTDVVNNREWKLPQTSLMLISGDGSSVGILGARLRVEEDERVVHVIRSTLDERSADGRPGKNVACLMTGVSDP